MSSRSSKPSDRQAPSQAAQSAGAPTETVEVARVRRAHGVRGAVLVRVDSDVEGRFLPGARLLVRDNGGRLEPLTIRSQRPQGSGLLLEFEELHDRDGAEALTGATLVVPRAEVPPSAEGWYFFDLLGCRCRDRSQGDLGTVLDVVEDGGGLLLEVGDGERKLLIPFVRSLVPAVDVASGRIEVDLPKGFLETCTSPY